MGQAMQQESAIERRPYEVRVDGAPRGAFRDVRDAISSARIKKRERPGALVGVADVTTGQFLFEIEV
ncbi:MAG: hypothetical protein ACK5JM_13080 [Rhodoblastus sp.]